MKYSLECKCMQEYVGNSNVLCLTCLKVSTISTPVGASEQGESVYSNNICVLCVVPLVVSFSLRSWILKFSQLILSELDCLFVVEASICYR